MGGVVGTTSTAARTCSSVGRGSERGGEGTEAREELARGDAGEGILEDCLCDSRSIYRRVSAVRVDSRRGRHTHL